MVLAGVVGVMTVGPSPGAAEPPRPRIAAHRGGALLWPENSLTAFRGALALGVELLELDVHQTRDGTIVVLHDATLERTTTGRGDVRALTWAEVAHATVKGTAGEAPPTLAQVLALLRPTAAGLLLEIKAGLRGEPYEGIEARVLAELAAAGLVDRTTVMAFEWDVLERLRVRAPTLRLTGLLSQRGAERLAGGVPEAIRRLRLLGVDEIGLEHALLTPEATRAARAAGLGVGTWTVNDADALQAALAADVDYVTTDQPALALRLRAARPR